MSEGIGQINGSIGSLGDSGGLDNLIDQLSKLIGKTDSLNIDMESGASCEDSSRAPDIFRRIDTLR
ncbi:MAG: hypothetical protein WC527_05985 [Candidatus Margulisiibacteriota bacterium]